MVYRTRRDAALRRRPITHLTPQHVIIGYMVWTRTGIYWSDTPRENPKEIDKWLTISRLKGEPMVRKFTEYDWAPFANAYSWPDSDPLICEAADKTIVGDSQGIEIYDSAGGGLRFDVLAAPEKVKELMEALAALILAGTPQHVFIAFGLKEAI